MGIKNSLKRKISEGSLSNFLNHLRWIYSYAKKYWKKIVIYTLLGLMGTFLSLFSGFATRDMVDIITGHQVGTLIATFAFMIGVTLGNTIINQVSNYISSKISITVESDLKAEIFYKIMITDWESLSEYHTGDILTRWNSDVAIISNGILNFVPNFVVFTSRFVVALIVMLQNDWTFAAITFLTMPLSIFLSKHMMKKMRENSLKTMEITSKISGFNQETFSNIQTIKSFSLVPQYIKRLHTLQKEYFLINMKYQRAAIWIAIFNILLSTLVSYLAYGWGIYRVWSNVITYGTMTLFISLSGTLSSAVNSMISLFPMLIKMSTSAQRLMDLVEMPLEDFSNDSDVKEFAKQNLDTGISICLDKVNYSYKNGNEVFKGASIEANPHEAIALVGPSGEGKTTMLRLILALINKKGGEAELYGENSFKTEDGKEEKSIPLNAAARQLFSYVPQGNTMLSGTIAENMRFVKPDATDEEIWNALDMACAKDFVEKMADGINSELKERGGGISEGQAQRLSIARALLRKSPLLLLDEATSALDVATERRVLKNIMKDEYPRTLIVTTHRPTVLSACNRVYAIQDKKCKVLNEEEINELVRAF